ncbi:MAG: ubiquinol oxidase subunit II [Desulfosarcinaceae bacterium]
MKRILSFLFGGLAPVCAALLLSGCSHYLLLDPKGPIGLSERFLIYLNTGLMLIVVIPVVIMLLVFPRKYRASNTRAKYMPKWSHSAAVELVIWIVPAVIVIIMAALIWIKTHELDPYKPIEAEAKPLNIEVVSLDWKWLFIYPDHQVAAVNQLVFPAQVPLSFRLTSATVMSSFFIPRLGSQIYTMAGMQTRLHLFADEAGTYLGQNQEFSGRGYANMHFKAIALSREEFADWLQKIKQSPDALDLQRYETLARPDTDHPVMFFSSVQPGLFDHILRQFNPDMKMSMKSSALNDAAVEERVPIKSSEEK